MTLREALKTVDLPKVYALINERDNSCREKGKKKLHLKSTIKAYTPVVGELLCKLKVKAYKFPLIIQEAIDKFDNIKYADVSLFNPKYVAPKKGLKPWGCSKGQNPPKGYYNVNDDKHSQYFGVGFIPWSKLIDTPIINKANYTLEKVVAEILWEITFYGWTEEENQDEKKALFEQLELAKKEAKEGKCITLPPKKKGGFKIVLPNSFIKQVKDIINKQN